MELLFLTAGVAVGGLLMFLLVKTVFRSKNEDEPMGVLMVEYFDPDQRPNLFLALDVEPDVVAKKKHVRLKVKKHVSHK